MNFSGESFRNRLLPIACAQAFGVACGVAGVKIVSRLVEPAVLGQYGIFLSFATVGVWFVHAGVVRYVSRNWAGSTDKPRLWRAAAGAWARKLGWVAACVAVIGWIVGRGSPGAAEFAVFLFVAAAALSLGSLAQTALQAERSHWRDFATAVAGSVTRTFAPPLLYLGAGSVLAMYGGYCLHALCLAGVGLWLLRSRSAGRESAEPRGKLDPLYDGPLFSLLALANWTLTGVARWIVAWRFGAEAAGQFTLAGNMALIIPAVLGAVLLQYCQPGFFAIMDASDAGARPRLGRYVDRVVLLLGASGLLGLMALYLLAPRLVGLVIDAKYLPALEWILPAGCFGLAVTMAQFYHVMMVAIRRERACAPVDLITAAVLVVGGVVAAWAGPGYFSRALLAAPLVVLVLTRQLARHYLLQPPAAGAAP